MVRLLVERSDTKSNVKLDGFWSRLQASYMSSHTEEFWYNETVSVDDYIYIYIFSQRPKRVGVDYSRIEYMRNII